MKNHEITNAIMQERFGKDSLIALATAVDNIPSVRTVDAVYIDGAFYVVTYSLSGKMQQIDKNPVVAVSGEWFTAQGTGENLGWFGLEENRPVAEKMRRIFSAWIDNGHNNFEDRNTVILRIRLQSGVLMSHGQRFDLEF